MRVFADQTGREWTVFEVKRQGLDRGGWSYLPEQFGSGWLCFESAGMKRRLSPVPSDWREVPDNALARLLVQAQPVARPRSERGDDADAV